MNYMEEKLERVAKKYEDILFEELNIPIAHEIVYRVNTRAKKRLGQCKFTNSKDNEIIITSCGGTKGSAYDSILNHPLDLLFCADFQKNLYVIPMNDLRKAGNIKSISLRTSPNPNNQGFNTYKYLVEI